MKLALIGGGGVRAPLFVASALRRAERDVRITTTTDPRAALEGARHAVTTMRVGFEQGRVHDERIALKYGVLGQETTGPGGRGCQRLAEPVPCVGSGWGSAIQVMLPARFHATVDQKPYGNQGGQQQLWSSETR